ncbi:MAG: alpha-hydroxy-acid oxidizing protein [Renibacterium salmoninarum]|nr:alpha-hydroxy-acid oxidizing protein [Renibacterium salmoninarum]
MANFGDYQMGIYLAGAAGRKPALPIAFEGLEAAAHQVLDPELLGYVAGGAGDERTQRLNVEAFAQWGLMPRMLVGAAQRDLSVELFGQRFPSPIFMSPVGVLGACREDGDLAVARASAVTGVPMFASTLSAATLEQVRLAQGATPGFFQLYPPNDPELSQSLVSRAEAAGYAGIVVTVDTWVNGWRPRDLSSGYIPMLRGLCLENYRSDPRFQELVAAQPAGQAGAVELTWAGIFGRPTLNWSDIDALREATSLPLIIKGICAPEDAKKAQDHGADGIICSNHGGRQANGGLSALQCLPAVVEATGLPVLFDSGVRSGTDVVKALALGARAVGIGRPYVYGLTVAGAAGVEQVLRGILAEADLLMAVDGYAAIADLIPEALHRVAGPAA